MFFSNAIISREHFLMQLRGDDVFSAPKLCSAQITSSVLCIVPNINSVPKMKYVGFPTKSPESKHGMRFTYRGDVGEQTSALNAKLGLLILGMPNFIWHYTFNSSECHFNFALRSKI